MNWYFKIAAGFVFLSAIALGLASLIRYFVLDPVAGNQIIIDQGLEMYTMEHKPWKYALYVHIITASIAILIGPIQFLLNKTRSRRLSIHRSLGKLYVIAIAISGVAGVYLSLYAFGGFLSKLGFFALSISWLVTTYLAYQAEKHPPSSGMDVQELCSNLSSCDLSNLVRLDRIHIR
jgi:uncharacterized membrane protein